jgi:Domain of unknown function (DUF4823)
MATLARAFIVVTAITAVGCAHTSVTRTVRRPEELLHERVFVMQAVGAQWTVTEGGRTYQKVQGFPSFAGEYIAARTLQIVREGRPDAELVDTPFLERAVMSAVGYGATYLVVPEVKEWYDAETQYTGVRDRIEIDLRLLRLRPRATIASVTFRKKSGILAIHDRPPTHLLDDSFRAAVRQLLGEQ